MRNVIFQDLLRTLEKCILLCKVFLKSAQSSSGEISTSSGFSSRTPFM